MQTIHLEGKVPHFHCHLSVWQIIMGSSVAKREKETNIKREKHWISSPDHHGQRSGQTETEIQGLCLHRQEHQLCLQRGEWRRLKIDWSHNWSSDCWGLLQRADCKMPNRQNGPWGELIAIHNFFPDDKTLLSSAIQSHLPSRLPRTTRREVVASDGESGKCRQNGRHDP